MEYIFEMKNVGKTYIDGHKKPVEALIDFSANFQKARFYGIVGASGAGKSTVLSVMGFMDSYTTGTMILEGAEVKNLTKRQMADLRMKKIGFVFQNYFLNPRLTVLDNIILPMKINKSIPKASYKDRGRELLKNFSVQQYEDSYPDKLSGGEQQRVCIARALANDPDIIMADEPTGNLDQDNELIVMEYLKGLVENHGKTVVMVSHSDILKKFADEILYMKYGRLEESL